MTSVLNLLQSHPQWSAVETIYHKLQTHGYKAFLAGGCVRDALLGIMANDLDVATDANPEVIEDLFEKTVSVGKVFGVMRVLVQGADIEVATFRTDGDYKDGRRPENIHFSSPQEDARRRDFTVNALFYDLSAQKVLDFVGGEADLRAGLLRAVGDPQKRFEEDHLRLLRAARFSAQLNFNLEAKSFSAVCEMAEKVKTVSGERIRDEMTKLLKARWPEKGLKVMVESGMMEALFPFRLRDNTWAYLPEAREPWQNLALFLRQAEESELKSALDLLRLSARERKAIEEAWYFWRQPTAFFSMNQGRKLMRLPREGLRFALSCVQADLSQRSVEIADLLKQWEAWGQELPRPLLGGEDVKGRLFGKAIGNCLEQAYELQLEGKLKHREEALIWLKDYLERES